MDDRPDWTLLGRYLRGECLPEEVAVVARWLEADAANADELEFLREIWDAPAVTRPPVDKERGWQALQASIAAAREPVVRPLRIVPVASTESRWRRRLRGAMAGLAAAAVVAVAVGAVTWRQHATASASRPGREYATTRGQRAEFLLADGTRVWLNADSRLQLLPGYGADARDVALQGEAYFVVRHDATRPFRVHTSGAVSEDLGTEFDVRAYADDPDERVLVTAGRVAVRPVAGRRAGAPAQADTAVTLGRGQMGRVDRAGRLSVIRDADATSTLAWREGRLKFDGRPLREVVPELERWYDLDITLEDTTLADVPVKLVLSRHSVDAALAIVAGVVDARYVRDGRHVSLTPATMHR